MKKYFYRDQFCTIFIFYLLQDSTGGEPVSKKPRTIENLKRTKKTSEPVESDNSSSSDSENVPFSSTKKIKRKRPHTKKLPKSESDACKNDPNSHGNSSKIKKLRKTNDTSDMNSARTDEGETKNVERMKQKISQMLETSSENNSDQENSVRKDDSSDSDNDG